MKKILIILTFVLATAFSASAQYKDSVYSEPKEKVSNPVLINPSYTTDLTSQTLANVERALKDNERSAWYVFLTSSCISVASAITYATTDSEPMENVCATAFAISSLVADISFIKIISISQDRRAVELYLNKLKLTF